MYNQTDLRIAARAAGHTTFDTGRACKRGHYAKRYTSNGGCVECINGAFKKPLSEHQAAAVQRYTFQALLPLQGADAHALHLYLASCMLQWERSVGVHPGVNNWQTKIEWAQAQGKPLIEVSVLVRLRDRKPWGVFDWHGKLQDRFRTQRGAVLYVLRCDRAAGHSVVWMKWIGDADPYVPKDPP